MGNRQSKLFQNTPVNTECNPYPSIHPPQFQTYQTIQNTRVYLKLVLSSDLVFSSIIDPKS